MFAKEELKRDIALLEDERMKARVRSLLAENSIIRDEWKRIALALAHAVELMRREVKR